MSDVQPEPVQETRTWKTLSFARNLPNTFLAMREMEVRITHHTRVNLPHTGAAIARCSCKWTTSEKVDGGTAAARMFAFRRATDAAEFHWRTVRVEK